MVSDDWPPCPTWSSDDLKDKLMSEYLKWQVVEEGAGQWRIQDQEGEKIAICWDIHVAMYITAMHNQLIQGLWLSLTDEELQQMDRIYTRLSATPARYAEIQCNPVYGLGVNFPERFTIYGRLAEVVQEAQAVMVKVRKLLEQREESDHA